MTSQLISALLLGVVCFGQANPTYAAGGQFLRLYWYERAEPFNPHFEGRLRVNSPEAVLQPAFSRRVEARENGLMLIPIAEDLTQLTGAALYFELWGGHPGTANKRVSINGRSTYAFPEAGAASNNCVYHYPIMPLKVTDLVNGFNAIQLACDQGTAFWGHFLIDNACLAVALTNNHPVLHHAQLAAFNASLSAKPDGDRIEITFDAPAEFAARIASVHFQGFYDGFDENGDGAARDWHGFTKSRQPVAWLGASTAAPFRIAWDTSMLPAQRDVAVRALVRLRGETNLVFLSRTADGLTIPARPHSQVTIHRPMDLPRPFWSRDGHLRTCTIQVDADPREIEHAELHVVTWTGGPGTVRDYFKINGRPFAVAEGTKHEVQYSRLAVEPALIRRGGNTIELLSDTAHHGIEVFLPGPTLVIRKRVN